MRRIVLVLVGLLFVAPLPASAGAITITWTGDWGWYNNDHRTICSAAGWDPAMGCDFFTTLESLGVSINDVGGHSSTPVHLSITLVDVMSDSAGFYLTTADVRFEFARLGLVGHSRQMYLAGDRGVIADPGITTLLTLGTIHFHNFSGFSTQPNTLLSAAILQQPLSALNAFACISLGSNCDGASQLIATSVSVPEVRSATLLLPGLLAFWCLRRRGVALLNRAVQSRQAK